MLKKAPNPIDKHVGSRVRMRRVLVGMSQERLGEALGLTFQQVQKYEKGTNRIGASRLQQIAGTLQVPVAFFFEELPIPAKAQAGAQSGAQSGGPAILRQARRSCKGGCRKAACRWHGGNGIQPSPQQRDWTRKGDRITRQFRIVCRAIRRVY